MLPAAAEWVNKFVGVETDAALYPPCSYEDAHASAQSILLPSLYPRGFTALVVQPTGFRNVAAQGKCVAALLINCSHRAV